MNPECSQLLLRITYHLFIVFFYKTLVIDKLMQVCYVLCVHLLFSLLKLHSGFFGDRHSLNMNCCLKTLYFFTLVFFKQLKHHYNWLLFLLRGLDSHAHLWTIFISFGRRALYKDTVKC